MKAKIIWTWKKIVVSLLLMLGIGMLTSCYGAPPPDDVPEDDIQEQEMHLGAY